MARGFLIVFALTNTSAVGAFSAFAGGRAALGTVLTLLALAGFVVTARVVVLARPTRHHRDEPRLKKQQEESLR